MEQLLMLRHIFVRQFALYDVHNVDFVSDYGIGWAAFRCVNIILHDELEVEVIVFAFARIKMCFVQHDGVVQVLASGTQVSTGMCYLSILHILFVDSVGKDSFDGIIHIVYNILLYSMFCIYSIRFFYDNLYFI